MNRQAKRMVQQRDEAQDHDVVVADDGAPQFDRVRTMPRRGRTRTSPVQFLTEVRAELRKVAWPTRQELVNYATVVFVTLVVIVGLIFALNLGFARVVSNLLQP